MWLGSRVTVQVHWTLKGSPEEGRWTEEGVRRGGVGVQITTMEESFREEPTGNTYYKELETTVSEWV